MTTIEDLRKLYDTEKSKSDYKYKLSRMNQGWLLATLAFLTAIITIIILLLDRVLDKDIAGFMPPTLKLEIALAVILVSLTFIAINLFSNRKLVKTMAQQHTDLVTVMKIFEALKNEVDTNNSKLTEFIEDSEIISKNLKSAPLSNLISWGDSGNYEKISLAVWSVSYSLYWLDDDRIDEILNELKKNGKHSYRYILLPDKSLTEGQREIKINTIRNKIEIFDKSNNTDVSKRFIVKRAKENKILPIPNDISIYQSFLGEEDKTQSIVVVNTHEFCNNHITHEVTQNDLDNKFDLRFKESEQINRLIKWYDLFWTNKTNFIDD